MSRATNLAAACPYEVGDILYTINATDPAKRWPGTTWQQITDRFVRGADGSHKAGSTGGSWTHVQTRDEMAKHTHYEYALYEGFGVRYMGSTGTNAGAGKVGALPTNGSTESENYIQTAPVGSGKAMDITNPYYAAYIWLRTA